MQIIPVLDLAGGVAVHAEGGDRSGYRPVRSAVLPGGAGDPVALLRAYREILGARECYLADLDAIRGGMVQRRLVREMAQLECGPACGLLVDAGVALPAQAAELLACGVSGVVVGLETLRAFADLQTLVERIGATRVSFSLDLRLGSPIVHPALGQVLPGRPDALNLARQAVTAGVHSLVVLDLGRVGAGCGADLELLQSLRRRFSAVRLIAGGGVRSRQDLERMRDAGCDAALVATAIHSGRITAADFAALAESRPPARQSAANDSRYVADCP
ncbi:MAG: hisA/hisF family protein [Gemmatimonadales bacterium]|nr:hisA/hisF family protein [Gemmatimonadales bacterium]